MADSPADTMAAVPAEDIETSAVSAKSGAEPAASPSPPPDALPASTFSLVSAAKFLYSHQQRERSETTDDGVSPYLLQRRKFYQPEDWQRLLAQLAATRTLYVGNLSFYTSEEQLWCFFSQCGRVLRVIMGLNERSMTPCGFCFVEYSRHQEALSCQRHLSGLMCDERTIRADLDPGFEEGRQFGRSKLTGGQIRDDHRKDFDPGRGGYVLKQQTTFASLIPGIITIRPPRSRKRQKIDLAAVRAARKAGRDKKQNTGQAAQQQTAAAAEARSAATTQRVGSKRRRDEEEDDGMQQQQADDDDDGGDDEQPAADDGSVDADEEKATDGDDALDEVVTSGAEGDVESAAETDGDSKRRSTLIPAVSAAVTQPSSLP